MDKPAIGKGRHHVAFPPSALISPPPAPERIMPLTLHCQQKQAVPVRAVGYAERVRELEQQVVQTVQTKKQIIQELRQSVEILAQQVQALTLENEELQAAVRQPRGKITPFP